MSLKLRNQIVPVAAALAVTGMSAQAADAAPAAKGDKDDLSKATQIFTPPALPTPALSPTSVVATVDGVSLTGADMEKEMQGIMMQIRQRGVPPEQVSQMMPRLRQQTVANLVNKTLLLQAVKAKKVVVGEDEIKKATDDILKNAPPGETLESALKQAGITTEQFKAQLTEGLSIQKLIADETKSGSDVTDADLKKYYDENPEQFKKAETASARHILIKTEDGADEAKKTEARKKAEGVRERLVKGEDFAKVCAETSDDPGSKNNGGLYENFPKGQMVPPFENACFTQKIGDIGPLVETTFGFHIIKVEKRSEAGTTPLDEVKDRLKAFLENQKKAESAQKYLKVLREKAKVTYTEGFEPPPEAAMPPLKK